LAEFKSRRQYALIREASVVAGRKPDKDSRMVLSSDIADFARRDLCLLGKTKPVLLTGTTGPAVIIVHEIYGFAPTLARFCRWVRDAARAAVDEVIAFFRRALQEPQPSE
jgi:hypothetical protein